MLIHGYTLPHALHDAKNLGARSQELEHNMLSCNKVSSNAHGKKEINFFVCLCCLKLDSYLLDGLSLQP